MKRKLEVSELIFKIISYVLLTVCAVACLYPFLYAISAAISGREAVEYGQLVLFPKDIQFLARKVVYWEIWHFRALHNVNRVIVLPMRGQHS